MKACIRIETVPNPNILVFHTTAELSETNLKSFDRPLRSTSEEYLKHVGEHGTALLKALLAMDGVVRVSIEPYVMRVDKGVVFEWADMLPGVIDALKKLYCDKYKLQGDQIEVTGAFQDKISDKAHVEPAK